MALALAGALTDYRCCRSPAGKTRKD